MSPVSLRTLETPKTFQGPRVLLFKGLHYSLSLSPSLSLSLSLSLLFPSHDVFSSSRLFLFALSPGVSVPFPLRLLPINNTETEQQPPLSPTGLNFKHITALTGHGEQAANAAAASHGKELITQGRITLVSLQTNPEGNSSHCCNSSCMTFSKVPARVFFFLFLFLFK